MYLSAPLRHMRWVEEIELILNLSTVWKKVVNFVPWLFEA